MKKRPDILRKSTGLIMAALMISVTGCASSANNAALTEDVVKTSAVKAEAEMDEIAKNEKSPADTSEMEEIVNSEDGGHAITADGENASYSNVKVIKTGEADGANCASERSLLRSLTTAERSSSVGRRSRTAGI